jgi:hypothetical protein
MGLVVERKLGSRHTLGIFLASGIGAGIAYAFAHPNALVIGSSAAISGLLLAGYLVDVKKAFLVLAAALILIPAFVYPGVNAGLDWLAASRTAQELQASAEEQVIGQQLVEVRGQIEAGNATPENVALEQNLTQLVAQAGEQRRCIAVKKQTVVVGRAREEATPVSFDIHVIGMVIAAAYLLVFRKDAYRMFINDFKALWRWSNGFGEHRGKAGRKRA